MVSYMLPIVVRCVIEISPLQAVSDLIPNGSLPQACLCALTHSIIPIGAQVYGADAAQSARTVGSISKDLAEMAWNINSMGLKAPLKAFGKGFFKGSFGY